MNILSFPQNFSQNSGNPSSKVKYINIKLFLFFELLLFKTEHPCELAVKCLHIPCPFFLPIAFVNKRFMCICSVAVNRVHRMLQ